MINIKNLAKYLNEAIRKHKQGEDILTSEKTKQKVVQQVRDKLSHDTATHKQNDESDDREDYGVEYFSD